MSEYFFDSRQEASAAAAAQIAKLLTRRLDQQNDASLVVSGGTTPIDCFAVLASTPLDWKRVQVLLSDERWVAADHDDSNESLVRQHLLTGQAAAAQLQPVYDPETTPDERCAALQDPLPRLPFAAALIGMGADGHFASLFPDAANLQLGLDVDSGRLYIPVATSASPHPRVSMTLAGISRSDEVVLLIFGDEKLDVYNKAKQKRNGYPVSRLLWQKRAPVKVYWAP